MSLEAGDFSDNGSLVSAARAKPERSWARTSAVTAALLLALSGCGGDDRSTPGPVTPQVPEQPVVQRALVISLDGATYAALQSGMAAQSLPHLAQLQVQLAYSGGVAGTPSQQPTLDAPGWASLLTGTWAGRHGVLSAAPNQSLRSATLFERLKDGQTGRNAAGTSAAVVESKGLAQLLSSDRGAGYLDALTSCAGQAAATDCVTTGARQMIAGEYRTVLAQYHAASDAVLNHGQNSRQYAATLATLDQAIGQLIAATAARENERWLITVTGNHGFSGNSQDDGLPLLPESTTFIALNQAANNAKANAEVPTELAGLYAHASIADIAPTVLGHLGALPDAKDYPLDGGSLVGTQPVSQLTAQVRDNNSSAVSVALSWTAPAQGTVSVLRDGEVIASHLPAGTKSFSDLQLSQVLTAKGTYQFNYTLAVAGDKGSAARAILSPSLTYVPPVPLAPTLKTGLVSYYPFGNSLPPVDAMGHSSMAPFAPGLPPEAGLVVPGPFTGTHGLLIDTNFVTSDGFEGYKLTPAAGFDVSQGAAPQFTLGFWFKTQSCVSRNNVTLVSNKNYVSGGNAGVAIGMFASSGNQCGIAFNIGSGGVRADGPTSPYSQITVDRWVYIAFSVDGVAKTMNMLTFDSVTGQTNRVATNKSTGSVDLSKLSPYPQWGIGDDGTGKFLMNKCNGTVKPPYTAGLCATAPTYQHQFGDLAMWNRVLSDAELQSIVLSNKPLSTLP